MGNLSLVTIIIIAANAIISYKGFNDYGFFERYKFNVGAIRRGEQIRIFSAGFLHVDMMHLIFNMFTLYFFADIVVMELGNLNFIIIYIISLILAICYRYIFTKMNIIIRQLVPAVLLLVFYIQPFCYILG